MKELNQVLLCCFLVTAGIFIGTFVGEKHQANYLETKNNRSTWNECDWEIRNVSVSSGQPDSLVGCMHSIFTGDLSTYLLSDNCQVYCQHLLHYFRRCSRLLIISYASGITLGVIIIALVANNYGQCFETGKQVLLKIKASAFSSS